MITRADMSRELDPSPSSPTKTFIIEAHTEEPEDFLAHMVGKDALEKTADAYLYRLHLPDGIVWVDQLDERFWSVHTGISMRTANSFLKKQVERYRELDWIWLPSNHLRNMWPNAIPKRVRTSFNGQNLLGPGSPARNLKVQLYGDGADRLLDYISQDEQYRSAVSFDSVQNTVVDPDFGILEEGVSRMGRFAATGNSFEFHLQFVRAVVERYKAFVLLCESKSIGYSAYSDGGGSLTGGPIGVRFSRQIEDLSGFLAELFSSRHPYRLWGIPEIHDGYATVDAVDLHIGSRVRLDIGSDWLRIYLTQGCCGNSVARLVANLQHTFDGALRLDDPELQDALNGNFSALQGGAN
ncbi:hypothetical protein SK571_37795 [Lentzea sp. BCCO 10_0798]|uniref:Uncharacterized protein n=1 Tax=Lentzea kristufekii TaxID=3095430 RepID=A0ABU4U3K0_9PSEU|nr:hypothetical protein [Lentzea sp. BCCO 10_0798]MDX8055159.1 hypothetical protein [Lentzea sp. BCCO 10_0798]